jgi:hypothetical protein
MKAIRGGDLRDRRFSDAGGGLAQCPAMLEGLLRAEAVDAVV